MELAVGTRLGPYEVLDLIGAGGMGEVYRARDTRLDRTVAIKVLPADLASDPERRARFEREARTISTLNHPHICALYDVGDRDGTPYLVMEHLAGDTLARRLKKGPLPLDIVLQLGGDIADALQAAHRQGIVHRDLKPANVMLTSGGAKLLDFGLAKLTAPGDQPVVAGLEAATTEARLTGRGTIVGTLPYMAPEQLEGHEVDARTDLWALGAILHEMLTGQPAFEASSPASLIGAILNRDPVPVSATQPLTPPGLERLVRKCLAKQPDARWQSAADVADELRWVASGSGAAEQKPATGGARRRSLRWLSVTAVTLLLAGSAGLAWWAWTRRPAPTISRQATYRQVTFSGDVLEAALSPDGRTVAYAAGDQDRVVRVLVRDLAGGQALEVWNGFRLYTVAWTPDGNQVLLSGLKAAKYGNWLVPRLGGEPRRITAPVAGLLAISPDGASLAGTGAPLPGFRVAPLSGGGAHDIRLPGVRQVLDLRWGARANRLAVQTENEDGLNAVWTVAPGGQTPRRIYAAKGEAFSMCWSPAASSLYLQRFRNGATELVRLIDEDQAPVAPEVLLAGLPRTVTCSVSQDGQRLLQLREVGYANLWRVSLNQPAATPTAITQGTSSFEAPRLSRDGHSIVVTRTSGSQAEVVRIPVAGGEPTRLTEGEQGAWSPDGRQLAFVSERGESRRVWVSEADGQGAVEVKSATVGARVTWLPDGRLAWITPDHRNYRIRDLATGREESLISDPSVGWVFSPQFSPRGDQVAVAWNRQQDGPGLWVLSWPGRVPRLLAPRWLQPIGWSADGRLIYAYDEDSRDVVRIGIETGSVQSVARFPAGAVAGCDLSTDTRTAVCALAEVKSDAWLVEHFDPRVPLLSR